MVGEGAVVEGVNKSVVTLSNTPEQQLASLPPTLQKVSMKEGEKEEKGRQGRAYLRAWKIEPRGKLSRRSLEESHFHTARTTTKN